MSGAGTSHRSSPRPPLSEIARRLESATEHGGWGGSPLLVLLGEQDVSAGRPGPAATVRPRPPSDPASDDPVADLLGLRVPPDCSGLAVVAEGSGRGLVDDDSSPADSSTTPYRFAYVLDRGGASGCALRPRGGEVVVDDHPTGSTAGPAGRLVDVCHRALGLATAPPPDATTHLWLLAWLDLLLARSLGPDAPRTWSAVARLHPAMSLLGRVEGHVPSDLDPDPEALGRMGVALGRAQTWEELRLAGAHGEWSPHGVTADQAGWMDHGMYARWIVGEFLPEAVYLAELADSLPPAVARAVRVVARAASQDRPR